MQRSNLRGQDSNNTLPPDWVSISTYTGEAGVYSGKKASLNYSYDAFRVLWRIATDYQQSKDPRAADYLAKFTFFDTEYQKNKKLCTLYALDGGRYVCQSSIAAHAAPLSVLAVNHSAKLDEIASEYASVYGKETKASTLEFYDRSWYWFGLQFYVNYEGEEERIQQ
jgi:hypothetical protein